MYRDQVGMVLAVSEGATDVVVAKIDRLSRVRDSQVLDVNQETQECSWEQQCWFVTFVSPVIDRHGGWCWTKSAIEDGMVFLV
jgi:hypothetical protein